MGHRANLLGNTVNVGYDLQAFLFVNTDCNIQHQFQPDIALLPVKVGAHSQLLLSQMIADGRQHPLPASVALQNTAERQCGLKTAAGMLLPLSLIQDKKVNIPGNIDFFLHNFEFHISHGYIAPQNLENIRVVGGQGDFLFQPENIVFADGDLRHIQGHPAILQFFVPMYGNGRLFVVQFFHPGRHCHKGLDIQLPGIDHAQRDILHLSLHHNRIRRSDPLHVDLLVKGNLPLQNHQAAAILHSVVEHRQTESSPDSDCVGSGLDLIDHKLPLLQVQTADVRLVLRNIQVVLQGKLGERLYLDAVHMYISL